MTIVVWRILCLASMALFVAGLFALLFTRLLKHRYYRDFCPDELMRETETKNTKNSIYFTSGETKKYIKKYALCKTAYDKYLVCNFAKSFRSIRYFVVEYTKRKRVLAVQQATEYSTGDASKIISLHSRCASVNVVVGAVDGLEINHHVIRPLTLTKIRLYAFLKSFMLFLFLFAARHIAVELILGSGAKYFLADLMNYIALGASFAFCLLGYFVTVGCFRRKNMKACNGGSLEYEFL